jgi:hypothetical protein
MRRRFEEFPNKGIPSRLLLPRILLILAYDFHILDIPKKARCLFLDRLAKCSLLYFQTEIENRKTGWTSSN